MKFQYPCMPNKVHPKSKHLKTFDHDPLWIAEIKKNGWRCLVIKDGDEINFYTRHNMLINDRVSAEIREGFAALPDDFFIDGEILLKTGQFFAFDILYLNGKSLVSRSLKDRRKFLEQTIKENDHILMSKWVEKGKRKLYEEAIQSGEEGIVLKFIHSGYLASPTKCRKNPFWLKVKRG